MKNIFQVHFIVSAFYLAIVQTQLSLDQQKKELRLPILRIISCDVPREPRCEKRKLVHEATHVSWIKDAAFENKL